MIASLYMEKPCTPPCKRLKVDATSPPCSICGDALDGTRKVWRCSCGSVSHICCFAEESLNHFKEPRSKLIPTTGRCDSCGYSMPWAHIVQGVTKVSASAMGRRRNGASVWVSRLINAQTKLSYFPRRYSSLSCRCRSSGAAPCASDTTCRRRTCCPRSREKWRGF